MDAEAGDATLREHLGDVLFQAKMKDAAKAQWEKSLELDPKNVALAKKFKDAGFGEPPSANTVPDEGQKSNQQSSDRAERDSQIACNNPPQWRARRLSLYCRGRQ